jgi:hypothetical protein
MSYKAQTDFFPISKAQPVRSRGHNAITFDNVGDTDAYINGSYPLKAGKSFSISQTDPEVKDFTEYNVTFSGAGANPNVVVITVSLQPIGASGTASANCEKF